MTTTHQVRFAVLWLSIIVSSLVACSKREIELDEADPTMIKAITEKLIEASATSKSEKEVLWNPGDEIAVFSGELSGKFESTLKKKPSSAAVFRGDLGLEAWPEEMDIWAVYPYSEEASFDGETITTVLPSEQIAKDGEFGKDMNLAIAHSNTSILQFYNVGGGIRFSVTEEGIKKVIFEGLGGEIISGKVEIGFDEDGLPEIRKVVSGSQFITILPPDGQETFRKDTWYYLVAIPGSLEHGYKLRFYKDSDYARKVSEKTAVIKRSIFGSIEKADSGTEYEATTLHFPITEEEFSLSVDLTYDICEQVSGLLKTFHGNSSENIGAIVEEIEKVDGVQRVDVLSSCETIAVMQKDSVWINYFLDSAIYGSAINRSQVTRSSIATGGLSTNDQQQSIKKNSFVMEGKKALILSPFNPGLGYDYSKQIEYLSNLGFDSCQILDNDKDKLAGSSSLKYYMGDFLEDFDYILFNTHGGLAYNMYKPHGDVYETTVLSTAIKYKKKVVDSIIESGLLTKEQIALANVDGVVYLQMTPSFISDASFNNSLIMLNACHTAQENRNLKYGDMVPMFLNRGAGIVTGNNNTAINTVNEFFQDKILEFLGFGLSIQKIVDYLKQSELTVEFCNDRYLYDFKANPDEWANCHGDFLFNELYELQQKPALKNELFYLRVPPKVSLHQKVSDEGLLLWDSEWEREYHVKWEIDFSDDGYLEVDVPYKVYYDVYIDGVKGDGDIYSSVEGNTFGYKVPSDLTGPGHHWYVVASFLDITSSGAGLIESFKSAEAEIEFTIEQQDPEVPEAVDLGLSVNWASSNIGATKPDESGTYYAWGETSGKTNFSWENYKWLDPSSYTLTKYCGDPEYGYNGYVDSKTKLDNADDVARTILGDGWRMPTRAEFEELFNPKNCTVVWEELNGVNVVKLTSLKNGKVLYLPAVGIYDEDTLYYSGTYGAYWTSTFSPDDPTNAFFFTFDSSTHYSDTGYRYRGCPVRAVKAK